MICRKEHIHMFRRFAYQFQGPAEEGWTPPWLRDEGHGRRSFGSGFGGHGWRGPHFFGMHRGHGLFGPRSRGPFGPMGEGGRFFGRGDVKFALLELLQERPMHGYEMMKALEEKTGGFYTPSPGSIYPTLQMLEEAGLVSSNEVEGKKVYSITDAGRASLAERERNQEGFAVPPWMRWHGHGGRGPKPEMQALRSEVAETARLLAIAGRMALQDPEKLARLRSVIEHTPNALNTLIYSDSSAQGQPAQAEH